MNRIISIWILAMLMTGALMVVPNGMTNNTRAETIIAEATGSGTEWCEAADYADCLDFNGARYTNLDFLIASGQYNNTPGACNIYRGAVTFDASAIDTTIVTSAKLWVKVNWTAYTGGIIPAGHIDVYSRPASEATLNWTNLKTNMTYIGSLGELDELTNGTWHFITVPKASLSTADWSAEYGAGVDTAFYLVTSREGTEPEVLEEYVAFSHGTIDPPYISLTAIQNGQSVIRYWTDAIIYEDHDILPVERMAHNTSYDAFRYEIFVINYTFYGVDWMTIYLDPDLVFLAVQNPGIVTDLGAGAWNITEYLGSGAESPDFPPYYLYIWFLIPLDPPETEVNIQLWHSTLGEGFIWEKFKVMANIGDEYNASTAIRLVSSLSKLLRDQTYTFTIMDYFGNIVTTKTVAMSGSRVDILIPMDIPTILVTNLRANGSARMNIYFNGTGAPYTATVPAGYTWTLPIRPGQYMARVDYMSWNNASWTNTLAASYFENITVTTQDFDVYIGDNMLTWQTYQIGGIVITLSNIQTGLDQDDIVWSISDPIYSIPDTRGPGGFYTITDHPFIVITSTATFTELDATPGETTLTAGEIDESLMYGHWVYFSDTLVVSASDTTADMMINDTELATTIIDSTAPAGATYDIYTDNYTSTGNELTVWASTGGFSVHREIFFRWAREITWEYDGISEYKSYVTLNNSLGITLRSPAVLITFPELEDPDAAIDMSKVYLYDVDHNIYLSPSSNYSIAYSGISFGMATLSPASLTHYRVTFYTSNDTREGTEYIYPDGPPVWTSYQSKDYRMVQGQYTNGQPSIFKGGVTFILTDDTETAQIDSSTIIVVDRATGDELVRNSDYIFTGTAIEIFPRFVGSLAPGGTVSIRVLYLTGGTEGEATLSQGTILGIPAWGLFYIILIVCGLFAAMMFLSKNSARKKLGQQLASVLMAIGVIGTLIMVIMAWVG